MLVALRLTIGWHFLSQGVYKVRSGDFNAEGYLRQARGPLAEEFHALIPDLYGQERLDPEVMHPRWENYLARFEEFYKLTPEQEDQAEKILQSRQKQMISFLEENQTEIESYFHELNRLAERDSTLEGVAFQDKRIWDRRQQLMAQSGGWIAQVEAIEDDLHRDLYGLLEPDQRQRGRVSEPLTQFEFMNRLVVYSNIAIGVALIVGLFTRLAAVGGGLFLLTIVLSTLDFPLQYPAPHPAAGRAFIVDKEFVEMMALFALAGTAVGRWGGLDFFVHHLITRPLLGKGKADASE